MARHAAHLRTFSRPARIIRWLALAVLWLAGLMVGIFALLSIAATLRCGRAARGLACQPTGTALAALLVAAVICVVTTVTVLVPQRGQLGRVGMLVALGIAVLAGCYAGARALLNTA